MALFDFIAMLFLYYSSFVAYISIIFAFSIAIAVFGIVCYYSETASEIVSAIVLEAIYDVLVLVLAVRVLSILYPPLQFCTSYVLLYIFLSYFQNIQIHMFITEWSLSEASSMDLIW